MGPAGVAFITGITGSPDFPVTVRTYDTTFTGQGGFSPPPFGGDYDAFVSKLAADGSHLVYSTFLGGSGLDAGLGICRPSRQCLRRGSDSFLGLPDHLGGL